MYIAFGRKVVDTDEMKNEIEKNSEFKVLKDCLLYTSYPHVSMVNLLKTR